MSCDWDVWCTMCEVGLGLSNWNHETDAVEQLLECQLELAHLAMALDCTVSLDGSSYREFNPLFFVTHLGHPLVAMNEYGMELEDWRARHGKL